MEEKDFLVKLESLQKDLVRQEKEALSNLRRLTRSYNLYEIYNDWKRSDIKFLAYFLKRFTLMFYLRIMESSSWATFMNKLSPAPFFFISATKRSISIVHLTGIIKASGPIISSYGKQ